jgi:OOP family OmpA-OmpF porin
VREDGCALLDGIMSNIKFVSGTADLTPASNEQLDFLVNVLAQYPAARIQLLAHTDNTGTKQSQSILTRARLKTVGLYLVSKGVSASRLQLRSFGGSRPAYDNATAEGRELNNRIEVLEYIVQ